MYFMFRIIFLDLFIFTINLVINIDKIKQKYYKSIKIIYFLKNKR